MALDFLRREKALVPTHDELTARVNVLAADISRLSRELDTLKRARTGTQASTNGPVPISPEAATSGRSLIRFIGVHYGRNEDAIRKALVTSPMFADLRDQLAHADRGITTDLPILRWLASPAQGTTELRFGLISGGHITAKALAIQEKGA